MPDLTLASPTARGQTRRQGELFSARQIVQVARFGLGADMPFVTYRQSDGARYRVEAPAGDSLMRIAANNGIEGIIGDCGGVMSCATCHVFVAEPFLALLPPILPNEDDMLDCTAQERRPNSRLSCQITLTDALDGIEVQIADPQL